MVLAAYDAPRDKPTPEFPNRAVSRGAMRRQTRYSTRPRSPIERDIRSGIPVLRLYQVVQGGVGFLLIFDKVVHQWGGQAFSRGFVGDETRVRWWAWFGRIKPLVDD
jgi:hypothetical protein